ncbi:sulfite exporter TauE/SafE family protein [Candidatus Parabeggiatoa sp. HSG14]|uniref:sulfite exporter TauE/SafE family protein n=1 Tax=Candidatus Parabeggiatoa sp. HSG14 TaxID=3055593 RepID=UPI0025A77ACF|nr:sulfite exporter TauE/SafE family protein [Thiotrichales bacterium HSG14]
MEALPTNFIDLQLIHIVYLFLVGFIGGLVSGFIGSGGAFVLTPAMMSLGVPGIVAVASNMCHKFPKALIGSLKRAKFGQVDLKLGLIFGLFAEGGVLIGAELQEYIRVSFGKAGSDLYVSLAFVVILGTVGSYVLYDALKSRREDATSSDEQTGKLARRLQSINIPGTMVYFKSLKAKISLLFILPLGFATGMLAATIAVGGFIGVPAMIYALGAPSLMASATELVVAFVMGMGGTIKFAWGGFVDVRLAMIILAGSLFGVQLGAIGTTYVKPYVIKLVMGLIMVIVLFSRALMVPVYLAQLEIITVLDAGVEQILRNSSFVIMAFALISGALIVLGAMWSGLRTEKMFQQTLNNAITT